MAFPVRTIRTRLQSIGRKTAHAPMQTMTYEVMLWLNCTQLGGSGQRAS